MQLQITTDYAVRIINYLFENRNKLCTSKEMADQLGITYKYFMKVVNRLKQVGIVESVQGCNGGYYLAPEAQNITIYDIVRIMEGEIVINRCLEHDKFCSINATSTCQYHKMFCELQKELVASLKEKRIADFANTSSNVQAAE